MYSTFPNNLKISENKIAQYSFSIIFFFVINKNIICNTVSGKNHLNTIYKPPGKMKLSL